MEVKNYIDGKWVADNLKGMPVINPANGEQLAIVPLSTTHEVNEAAIAAKRAQKQWSQLPAPKRADFLYEIGFKLKEKKEYLGTASDNGNGQGD